MYLPPHFTLENRAAQHDLISAHPLGLLISTGAEGLVANPIPFVLDREFGPLGRLRGHLARPNPQWHSLAGEVLVVFSGPDHYISPSYYQTKRETGKVVPTWNYLTLHAYGQASVHEDAQWLGIQIRDLTSQHENARAKASSENVPWAVDDAPESFIAAQMRGIVGIEIELNRLEGKAKLSQNRNEADREGVKAGLAQEPGAAAKVMAGLIGSQNQS